MAINADSGFSLRMHVYWILIVVYSSDSTNAALKKIKRNRDDLTISPDLAKTGKRARKTNSFFSDFQMDKVRILYIDLVHM
jgi:hypothetical protein